MRISISGLLALVLWSWAPVADAREAGVVQLSRKTAARSATGKLKDVAIDRADVKIEEAPPLGQLKERPVPRIARRPLRKTGKLDPATFAREVSERFRDFELCRLKVARLAGVPLGDVAAGQISVRWTVLASGRTRGTLVFEGTETDLPVMKCARRRMNAWQFTPPTGGPVEVEYDYDFSPSGPA